MTGRFIDRYRVLMLDMGNTFMFGADRFGENENFAATYRAVGGTELPAETVHRVIRAAYLGMLRLSRDPARYDDYPTLREFLRGLPEAAGIDERERNRLMEVFARHELGVIPPPYVQALQRLRETHPLGLISNIWAPSRHFVRALHEAGVFQLFRTPVFSSDHRRIKPSRYLFAKALEGLQCDPDETLYVGDNFKRDVVGAKSAGMGAIWIKPADSDYEPQGLMPDLVVSDLLELLER
jgi:putative hydrolase of the HAD superfamily/5'-nucleotidase